MTGPVPSSDADSLATVVVETVAAEMDADPTALPESLYEVIDGDALNALFAGAAREDGKVVFQYCDVTVTVTAEGDVSVER